MQYVIGIDSGGTKYLVKALDLAGNTLAEFTGEPASHYRVSEKEALRRIERNIGCCLAQFGAKPEDCVCLVCGTTGLDSDGDRRTIEGMYRLLPGFRCPEFFVNDAEAAHFAATGGVGVVVIAGTGSIAYGRNSQGETARCGGWPLCIFGDEGSGAWIARQGLYHLTLWFDGQAPRSCLTECLCETLCIRDRKDLLEICRQIDTGGWKDPGLAALTDRAADAGDEAAARIIEAAARHTCRLAEAVIEPLGLDREKSFKAGAWGSAIVKSQRHFRAFRQGLLTKYPGAEVLIAERDAADGAGRMALCRFQKER
ncbi:BadF/BadG/BcrA/BcrD ATPase family protein [Allofournierella sp.]|uniref:BadF/BadG/BcrA/BcrD ATPase family protein n=1 Tax=Allofournierella sp. TaxID=1940256 RepID=UPI003AB6003E